STSGVPIRALCQVTMEEISGDTPRQNPTSGGLAARRTHRVQAGDTLPRLAWLEYGDPAAWRATAELNGIDDPMPLRAGARPPRELNGCDVPMRLRAGAELLLPDADELG